MVGQLVLLSIWLVGLLNLYRILFWPILRQIERHHFSIFWPIENHHDFRIYGGIFLFSFEEQHATNGDWPCYRNRRNEMAENECGMGL